MSTNKFKLGATLALTLAAVLLAPTQVFAKEYFLKAEAFDMPDPNGGPTAIRMWGYATCADGSLASCSAVSVPGPALTVPVGDTTLTVHLSNNLDAPTSLVINGLYKAMTPVWFNDLQGRRRVRSFDVEAGANGTADYTWANVKPGTYLYQSGTQPQLQVQMGLYGAVTANVADAVAVTTAAAAVRGQAYVGTNYTFDNEATLLYSEIDLALHAAVAAGTYGIACPETDPGCGNMTSTLGYAPAYFLINGKPYQIGAPVIQPVPVAGTTTLVRMLNAGLTTHVPMIQGAYWDIIAEDGKPYPHRAKQYTALLPAAKTLDLLLTRTAGVTYAIMDRRLNLSNSGISNGGMLALLGSGALAGGGLGGGGGGGGTNLPPIAAADSYGSVAGVMMHIGAPGVLANDDVTDGPAIGAVAVTNGMTACGGSYTLNANGAFTYRPPVALPASVPADCTLSGTNPNLYVGNDTFTYIATDGGLTSVLPAKVTISASIPPTPTLSLLDDFNRADSTNLGATSVGGTNTQIDWSQQVATTTSVPDIRIFDGKTLANTTTLGGLAVLNQVLLETQGAAFSIATPLGNSALVLKATGGTAVSPANYVRVRCEAGNGGEVVVATMMGGSNVSTFVKQAAFAASGCGSSGSLSAVVDAKGLVTAFLNGSFVGGVQLADVAAWKGPGRIGIQLQTQDATVDNFSGGSL
jgi:FtsP/CotA-like multicopper oxidase with cupredoxin domain